MHNRFALLSVRDNWLALAARCCFACLLVMLLPLSVKAQDVDSREKTIADFHRMGLPFYENNKVKILATGIIKFDDLFPEVERAEHFIHLDYFKFQQDSICDAFFGRLRKKAQEGVEVRVVFDGFGNSRSDLPLRDSYIDSLRADGIQIFPFDPMRFPYINHAFHRDHHKIAIVDGRMVYSGGMNVADYYLHGKPVVGEWRDMHMRLDGSVVAEYERTFEDMWKRASGEVLDEKYLAMCGKADSGRSLIAVADRVPRKSPSVMRDTYITCIDNAQHHIQIVNPYITLTIGIRKALMRALRRGVRVEIMLSTKNDGPLIPDVAGLEMRKLQKRGAEIYYYENGFHHTKVMMVDDSFCTIGTTNLDGRSLKFDYEINSFIFDEQPTRELQEIFERDKATRCTFFTDEVWHERFPFKRRFKGFLLERVRGLL